MECPNCEGEGAFYQSIITYQDLKDYDCYYCGGTGVVGILKYIWYKITTR